MDEAFHSILLGARREATCRLDVYGMKRLALPFHVEADGIDHPMRSSKRLGDSFWIVNVRLERLKLRTVRPEQLATAITMSRDDSNEKAVLAQMLDDAAAEEAGAAEHGDDAHAHQANMRLILLAMMKSFSCSPLIFFVLSETVA